MEEIKIGEYFRSKSIGIMRFIYGRTYITKDNKEDYLYYLEYENKKTMPLSIKGLEDMRHSQKLTDLIQIGDYVNGQKIVKITKDPFVKGQIDLWTDRIIPFDKDYQQERFIENEIETVVTKEQFENMRYEK